VVAVGPGGDLKGLEVGDRVTTFAFRRTEREANHQQYITVPAFLVSRVPENITLRAAVTVNDSLATVFHTATADLGLDLPWPLPQGWEPPQANEPILIWGASSAVGIYTLQVLHHWGYRSLLAVSSARHHHHLRSLGATACFDYMQPNVVEDVLQHIAGRPVPQAPYIIDCIGSVDNTLRPLTKIAQKGAIVAAMLPFIVRDATEDIEPEYELDKTKILPGSWGEGVELRAVSTYTYLKVCSNQ
jgi:NADPH:quinone reductase-like Zn-dependent oxidoreductase